MGADGMFSRGRGVASLLGAGLLMLALGPAAAQDTAPAAPQIEAPAAQAPASPAPAPTVAPAPAAPVPVETVPPESTAPGAPAASGAPAPAEAQGGPAAAPTTPQAATSEPAPAGAPAPEVAPGAPLGVPAPGAPLPEAAAPAGATDATLPHDLSPWGMFMAADLVVKGVMVGLLIASLVTWTVWLAKTLEILGARGRLRKARETLNACVDLTQARRAFESRRGVVPLMVRATYEESRASATALANAGGDGLKERVGSHLGRIEAEAGRRMTRGTSILATIGSTAPFVGLFGTVWGIMNSFIGISQSQTTNLAVVAPGIAEALLATAMGLVAAIPAVVIYNHFARSITGYRQELADISANLERMVSRDLDHGRLRGFDLAAE